MPLLMPSLHARQEDLPVFACSTLRKLSSGVLAVSFFSVLEIRVGLRIGWVRSLSLQEFIAISSSMLKSSSDVVSNVSRLLFAVACFSRADSRDGGVLPLALSGGLFLVETLRLCLLAFLRVSSPSLCNSLRFLSMFAFRARSYADICEEAGLDITPRLVFP